MKRIYSSQDAVLVRQLKSLLDEHGIESLIRNEDVGLVSLSELAPIANWPELWVLDESKAREAAALIASVEEASTGEEAPWTCAGCGESHDGSFASYWNCGEARPAAK